MKRPGARLRAIVARLCCAQTMERLVDPTLADLQAEYETAVSGNRKWESRRIFVLGHIALIQVMAVHGGMRAMGILDDRTSCPERRERTYVRRTPPAARTRNRRTEAGRSPVRSSQPRAELPLALGLGRGATRTRVVRGRSDQSAPVGLDHAITGWLPRDLRLLRSYVLGQAARTGRHTFHICRCLDPKRRVLDPVGRSHTARLATGERGNPRLRTSL